MNFDEYEKKYQTRYAEFASVVRDILKKRSMVRRAFPVRSRSSIARRKQAI
jgi:hypothetical protein